LKKCITVLKGLSTLRLVNYVQTPLPFICYPDSGKGRKAFAKASRDAWDEVKRTAREHLKDCDSPGPKTLRTIALAYSEQTGVKYLEPEEEIPI